MDRTATANNGAQICYFPSLLRLFLHGASYVDQDDWKLDAPVTVGRLQQQALPAITSDGFRSPTRVTVINAIGKAVQLPSDHLIPYVRRASVASNVTLGEYPSRVIAPSGRSIKVNDVPPPYAAISYTWGRWMSLNRQDDSDAEGCHWKIPANTLFTRKDLDLAVKNIGGNKSVWLDVFCIPQDDSDAEKAVEIGKQGGIFANASHAAVWLCSGGEEELRDVCSWTFEEFIYEALDLRPFKGHLHEETRRRLMVLEALPRAIPWLSSLWTLQEAALRRDAVFYDKTGKVIVGKFSKHPLTIQDLMMSLTQLETELDGAISTSGWMSPSDYSLYTAAADSVSSIALARLDSMNANELLLASHHRTCQRAHDKVYGIMGALGVQMPVDYGMDPAELERMFIVALNNKYPAEMHSFLQYILQPRAPSWVIGERPISFSAIRQDLQYPYATADFTAISPSGQLVARTAIVLSDAGLQNICLKLERAAATVGFDRCDSGSAAGYGPSSWREQQMESSRNMQHFATMHQLVLIPLGRAMPTTHIGSTFVYLLTRTSSTSMTILAEKGVDLHRIGLLLMSEAHSVDETTRGKFFIG
jgi:hypothetical protein